MLKVRGVVGLCVVILVAGSWLSAQEKKADDKKEPPAKAKGTLPQNWKKLGLTDEQVQKIYRVQTEYRDKIGVLEGQIKGMKDQEKTELEKVLTDAQKARLREIKTGETSKDEKKP